MLLLASILLTAAVVPIQSLFRVKQIFRKNYGGVNEFPRMEFDEQIISLVHDMDTLIDMKLHISNQQLDVVGIDAEWKPENFYGMRSAAKRKKKTNPMRSRARKIMSTLFKRRNSKEDPKKRRTKKRNRGGGSSSPVSLVQISTRTRCWVVDLQSLCRAYPGGGIGDIPTSHIPLSEEEELVNAILSIIFSDPTVLKLGMGPAGDLKRLSWSFPHLDCFKLYKSVLDISSLAKRVYPGVSSRSMEGLNKLCQHQLSRSIDKSMQCSDWSARPLEKEQLKYASLDSYALILLFDSMVATLVEAKEAHMKGVGNDNKSSRDTVYSLAMNYEVHCVREQAEQELCRRRTGKDVSRASWSLPGPGQEVGGSMRDMRERATESQTCLYGNPKDVTDSITRPLVTLRQVQMKAKPSKV